MSEPKVEHTLSCEPTATVAPDWLPTIVPMLRVGKGDTETACILGTDIIGGSMHAEEGNVVTVAILAADIVGLYVGLPPDLARHLAHKLLAKADEVEAMESPQ